LKDLFKKRPNIDCAIWLIIVQQIMVIEIDLLSFYSISMTTWGQHPDLDPARPSRVRRSEIFGPAEPRNWGPVCGILVISQNCNK